MADTDTNKSFIWYLLGEYVYQLCARYMAIDGSAKSIYVQLIQILYIRPTTTKKLTDYNIDSHVPVQLLQNIKEILLALAKWIWPEMDSLDGL